MPYTCTTPSASIQNTYVDDGRGNLPGECVSLVKRQCASLQGKLKATWAKGDAVKSNTTLAAGTAIASFDANGLPGHAAIYVSQDATGIWVWDQYNATVAKPGQPVGRRQIRFGNTTRPRYNGDNFYLIK